MVGSIMTVLAWDYEGCVLQSAFEGTVLSTIMTAAISMSVADLKPCVV
jgi:hypothetical protein